MSSSPLGRGSPAATATHSPGAATTAVAAEVLSVAVPALEISAPAALQERQLAEFNQWLQRWNNYQQHLTDYWQGRCQALQEQLGDAEGGGKVRRKGKGKTKVGRVEEKWCLRYQELIDFVEEHGHINVPKKFTFKHSPPLGDWVGRMRQLYKKKLLERSRVDRLERIGFEFVIVKSGMINFSVVWNKSYQALKAFRDAHGHCEVPDGHKPRPDHAELDGWILRQRSFAKKGKLPEHMAAKLRALGLDLTGTGRPFGVDSEEGWKAKHRALAEYCAAHGDCGVPSKHKELGHWTKTQREAYAAGRLPDHRVQLLSQLGFNFYAKAVDPWQRRLGELRAYKDKAGNTDVPKTFALNRGLGDFVYGQKMAYNDKTLSAEKIKVLEDMGFNWTLKRAKEGNQKKTKWEARFDELIEFKSKYGTLNVPAGGGANQQLVAWMQRQRKNQRVGVMKSEKYERLKALGFTFGGPKQVQKQWTEHYESLVAFIKETGHMNVPTHHTPDPQLYYWIGTQRQSYRKGKLSEDRLALLKDIEFEFASKAKDRNHRFLNPEEWERMYGQLEEYKQKHGHVSVPQRDGRLGSFVHYQRFSAKGGKLSQDYIDRLNGLGFSWTVKDDRWMQKYEALEKYNIEHGDSDVPPRHPLHSWVGYQRKIHQNDSLPEDRVRLLSSIGVDLTIPEKKKRPVKESGLDLAWDQVAWESRYKDLVVFKDEHGHCEVPSTCDLYRWMSLQRKKYQQGKLPDHQSDRLSEIGFNFASKDPVQTLGVLKVPKLEPVDRDTYLEDLWDKSYQELSAYKTHFGHCNIPIAYEANPSLGAWAFSQRMAYKRDKLSEDRLEKLNELGFSFSPQKK